MNHSTHALRRAGPALAVCLLAWLALLPASLGAVPQFHLFAGHSRAVTDLLVSPDGRLAMSMENADDIKLWDVASGRELRTIPHGKDWNNIMAFAPDSRSVVIVGANYHTLYQVDLATGTSLKEFQAVPDNLELVSIKYPASGNLVYGYALGGPLYVWDTRTGKIVRTVGSPTGKWSFLFNLSRDGKIAAMLNDKPELELWNTETGKKVRTFPGSAVNADDLDFSPDGSLMAVAMGPKVLLWKTATGSLLRSLEGHESNVTTVRFSPDGTSLLSCSKDQTARLWDVASGKPRQVFQGHQGKVSVGVFLPDGQRVITGGEDRSLRVWSVQTGKTLAVWQAITQALGSVAFSPASSFMAVRTTAGTIQLLEPDKSVASRRVGGYTEPPLNPEAEREISITTPEMLDQFAQVKLSADHQLAVASTGANYLELIDLTRAKVIRRTVPYVFMERYQPALVALGLSPDKKIAYAQAFDASMHAYDVATGKVLWVIGDWDHKVNKAAFSPDGSQLLLTRGTNDYTLHDARTGKELRAIKLEKGDWDGDTHTILLGDRKRVLGAGVGFRLWDLATGKVIRTFGPRNWSATAIAASPDGRFVALPANDSNSKAISLWDLETGKEIRRFEGHNKPVDSLAFSADGKILRTAAQDHTIRSWDVATGRQLTTTVLMPDGDWLCWTPEGYFNGSGRAIKELVYLVDGLDSFGMDQMFDVYYRPDIIRLRLAGGDAANYAKADMLASFVLPPKVSLELQDKTGSFASFAGLVDAARLGMKDGRITARLRATDTGSGVETLRLFVNGNLAGEASRGLKNLATPAPAAPGELVQVFELTLGNGDNVLRAVAVNPALTESAPAELTVAYTAPQAAKPTLWVLACGINAYRNSRYALNYAVGDVQSFLGGLQTPALKLFGTPRVTSLLDQAATKAGLEAAFANLAGKVKPEDVFIFFYAGHGIALDGSKPGDSDFYFVLQEVTQMTSLEGLRKAALSGPEFRQLAARIQARKQLVILDACNSGALSEAFATRGAAEEQALARLSKASGNVLIAASQSSQNAQEFKALGHGALTQALMEGLAGGARAANGQITASSLKSYVEEFLPVLTSKYAGAEQFPTGFAFGQDFPIGLAP